MRNDLTDITLVVDRSGSMNQIREDAEGGVNSFIQRQAQEPGEAMLTLVQFDTEYEFVHRGVSMGNVPKYELHPRGMTALLDAVGRSIHETGLRLANMKEEDRPGLVVFVIMTDGHENSSVEFSKSQVKKLIGQQQSVYNWQFVFLGADQDAFDEAASMGISADGAATFNKSKVGAAIRGTCGMVGRMRAQSRKGQEPERRFTAEEREEMK